MTVDMRLTISVSFCCWEVKETMVTSKSLQRGFVAVACLVAVLTSGRRVTTRLIGLKRMNYSNITGGFFVLLSYDCC